MVRALEIAINQSSGKITRRHSRQKSGPSTDAKGERFSLQGKRWRFPRGLAPQDVEARISRLRELWGDHEQFCERQLLIDLNANSQMSRSLLVKRCGLLAWSKDGENKKSLAEEGIFPSTEEVSWTPLALWIAERIKHGVRPVPLPPFDTLIESVSKGPLIDTRFVSFGFIAQDSPDKLPVKGEDLRWQQALLLFKRLSDAYPSVAWTMPELHIDQASRHHEQVAQQAISIAAKVRSQKPPAENTPLIPGTFHEALREYAKDRETYFTRGGEFAGSGHQMIGYIGDFQERQKDVPLAMLDFSRCQELYDFWRDRPPNLRTGKPLSHKTCKGHIGELTRFFMWLHKTQKFAWRRPEDFDLIETKVTRLPSDRRSIQDIDIKTFSVEHLTLLYKHALPPQRLKMLWCLNCSHGAAEIGRVQWSDLFLNQPHPWTKEGLQFDSDSTDSWCGLLRPKTDVVGWWLLWPETVQLVEWWNAELEQRLKRELKPSERMLLTDKGANLYRDSSRNAQSSFSNEWSRLRSRVTKAEGKDTIPKLPFGTLRDQFSNWLGSEQNRAVIASVALAHGIPHKGDKLLFKHYSNRPWAHLFEAQKECRQHLQPMFDEVPDPLVIHDPLTSKIVDLWNSGQQDIRAIAKECDVHSTTVRRKLRDCELA